VRAIEAGERRLAAGPHSAVERKWQRIEREAERVEAVQRVPNVSERKMYSTLTLMMDQLSTAQL